MVKKVTRGRESLSIVIIVTHSVLYTYHLLYFFIFINHNRYCLLSEAVARRCSMKKVFLEISQKLTGKNLYQSLFNKVPGTTCNFVKKETLTQVSSCEYAKFLRTPLFIEHLGWLLLPCVNFFKF